MFAARTCEYDVIEKGKRSETTSRKPRPRPRLQVKAIREEGAYSSPKIHDMTECTLGASALYDRLPRPNNVVLAWWEAEQLRRSAGHNPTQKIAVPASSRVLECSEAFPNQMKAGGKTMS